VKNHLHILISLATMLVVVAAKAQDSRAYAKEDVPLSHFLEAKIPGEAWQEIEKASAHFPPSSHSETSGDLPKGEPRTKYIESWLVATADKAQEFYTKFPNDTNAPAAELKELDELYQAFDETYTTNLFPRIFTRATAVFKDDRVDKAKRLEICNFIFMTALTWGSLSPPNINIPAELREDARILEKDFRDLADFHVALAFAEESKYEKKRPLFRELEGIPGMPGLAWKAVTTAPVRQKEALGKPLSLQFKTLDGRNVNTTEMKGKVIVIDFWGNSYPESINNVLRLEKLYQKSHASGLEVIGVNVDHDSDTLKKFVSEHKIEWPQYWDGKEMENKLVQTSHVTRANTILLIDKKGQLRDIYGDEDMDKKIEALLKE
jgi:cytochrome oxidase Cu insertion factor (SCO1/SenC/PrrC family)